MHTNIESPKENQFAYYNYQHSSGKSNYKNNPFQFKYASPHPFQSPQTDKITHGKSLGLTYNDEDENSINLIQFGNHIIQNKLIKDI